MLALKRAVGGPEVSPPNTLMMVQMLMSGIVPMKHDRSVAVHKSPWCPLPHSSVICRAFPVRAAICLSGCLWEVSPVCLISDRQRETHLLSWGMCQNGFLTEEKSQLVSPLRQITQILDDKPTYSCFSDSDWRLKNQAGGQKAVGFNLVRVYLWTLDQNTWPKIKSWGPNL